MFVDLKIKDFRSNELSVSSTAIQNYKKKSDKILIDIEEYLLDEYNILDASKIEAEIFPNVNSDVFISHSHTDQESAIKIAVALEKLGLNAFVDSCVWGHADELQRKIDDKFCKPKGWHNYSYSLRNRTTSNVHLILNSALHKMIDSSELLIFLDTENSVRIDEYINNEDRHLASPWIFSELMFAKRVQKKPRTCLTSAFESISERKTTASLEKSGGVEFRYEIPDIEYSIGTSKFVSWLNEPFKSTYSDTHLNGLEHLDRLYKQIGVSPDLLKEPRFHL